MWKKTKVSRTKINNVVIDRYIVSYHPWQYLLNKLILDAKKWN